MKALNKALLALALFGFSGEVTIAQQPWKLQPNLIQTPWASKVNPKSVLPEYPRPQLARKNWKNLNGPWTYAITAKETKMPFKYDGIILVPYPVESALSGVKRTLKPDQLLWYKRSIVKPATKSTERVLLNFGAVDFEATVYLNGVEVGKHTGGYQAFSIDITDGLKAGGNELVVKVWDPSDAGPNPHGKQVLNPEGIMYTPSSGIWQTVWLETVPTDYIESLTITPDVDKGEVSVIVKGKGKPKVTVPGCTDCRILKQVQDDASSTITVKVPNVKLWSPDEPFLYDLEVILGKDKVKSYFGMRKIEVKKDAQGKDRIFLNGKYTFNHGTLDQGFWPDGLYTAPTDEALKYDVQASKAMGFNTIRKHIKVEPARWYYWADKLGMLVWQDMVNPGNLTSEGKTQFEKECKDNIAQLYNHPSIVTWVLFNEKWGQYDQERLTKWMKKEDPTRLVNGHSGEMLYVNNELRSPSPNAWIGADMTDVHAYPNPGHLKFENGKAAVLGEFGGIGVPVEGHLWDDMKAGWGYDGVVFPPVMRKQYAAMVDSLKRMEVQGLTASIYTQPFDVESEQNGLMSYDRKITKLPVEVIRSINARLWPATKNYAEATAGFSAKIADTLSQSYAERVDAFKKGKREETFLRSLAMMAISQKDKVTALEVAEVYIKSLRAPYSTFEVSFVEKATAKSSDPGYKILMDWLKQDVRAVENPVVALTLQKIIFNEQVKALLTTYPDWKKIDDVISASIPLDGEYIRGLSVVHYMNAALEWQANALENAVDAATRYDELYNSGNYNAWAWLIFEKSKDRKQLEKALYWSKKSIVRAPQQAEHLDTYANLLYKLGRKAEALEWQEKAVKLSNDNEEMKANYDKMLTGAPTWPVN